MTFDEIKFDPDEIIREAEKEFRQQMKLVKLYSKMLEVSGWD